MFLQNCLELEIFGAKQKASKLKRARISVGIHFSSAILSPKITLKGGIENNTISCHNFSRQKRETNL